MLLPVVAVMTSRATFAVAAVLEAVPPFATGNVPVTPVVRGNPVALVNTPADGVPIFGVVKVGDACMTNVDPVPVCAATAVALPVLVIGPVRLALVVTVPAVNPAAVPVIFVPTNALGVPNAGVTRVGLVANTAAPLPVSSVRAAARFADEGVARKVATPVPSPLTPVAMGNPVAFVSTAEEGVPNAGVTKVGLVAKTADPLPVSSVRAAAKLADEGVARNVATPVPSPLTPVETGSPVQFVRVPLVGVPSKGVTRVGLVESTTATVPVEAVTPVPPFATASVPARVTAPAVAEEGVRPVVPAEKLLTNPPASAEFVINRVPS